jgi:hypothetical protein
MADYGYADNVGAILLGGNTPPITQKVNLGTIANCYAGRLLTREDTDYDRKACTAMTAPTGWLGYELTDPQYTPAAVTTIYTVDDKAVEHKGGGFPIKAKLVKGCSVTKGQSVINWADGQVAGPAAVMEGGIALGIPFTKKTSEQTTDIELPADLVVKDVIVDVGTNVASGTIDVGLLNSEASGDPDGFLDAESCASAGKVKHNMVDATAANNTLGDLLVEVDIKDATGTPVYYSVPTVPGHVCDGTTKTISYTTSNHTIAGTFWVVLEGENLQIVGKSEQTVDASTGAANMAVLSKI